MRRTGQQRADKLERERRTAELRAAHDLAVEASRLKSQFLATMGHELRAPLNGVLGMTALLLDTRLDDEQREYAESISTSGTVLQTVLNDILDFARIEAGELDLEHVDFDVRHVVEGVAGSLAEPAHRKGLDLVTLVHPAVPLTVRGDPGRLRQILTNLVGNAVRSTEAGEVVTRVGLASSADESVTLEIEVSDTGIGATGAREAGATGLGLGISRQLVALMGGELQVRGSAGAGGTFAFTARMGKGRAHSAPSERDLAGIRVLLAGGSATGRAAIRQLVTGWGAAAAEATDAEQALTLMRLSQTAGSAYDVAIIDLHLPGTTGLDLARQMRAEPLLRGVRTMLLTAAGARGDARVARAVGVDGYLTKPVREEQLSSCLAMVLGRDAGDPSTPLATRHHLLEAQARRRPHVLLAEDDEISQKVAVRILETLGYRVDAVGTGGEAVESVRHRDYAAVLMGCHDGCAPTAAISELRAGRRNLPIIALTAATAGDRQRCLDAGVDDCVAKPLEVGALQAVLETWLPGDRDAGDDPLPELVSDFLHRTAGTLGDLRHAVVSDDLREVVRLAHRLRETSGGFAAHRLAGLLDQVERQARAGQADQLPALLPELERELARVRDAWRETAGPRQT